MPQDMIIKVKMDDDGSSTHLRQALLADTQAMQSLSQAVDKNSQSMQNLGKETKNLENNSKSLSSSFGEAKGQLLELAGGAVSLGAIGMALRSAIDEAEKMNSALTGLAVVARYAGIDMQQAIDGATTLASDGLMTVADSSKALQNLLSRGFSLQESIDVLNRLKDAAAFNRQAGLSMSEAILGATEGIKNENSVLVDNAGVTKNVAKMWEEYAKAHGIVTTSMTMAQKREAEYQGIMKETTAQIGNAKLAAEGLTGAKARMSSQVATLNNALGQALTPAFIAGAQAANYFMNFLAMVGTGVEKVGLYLGLAAEGLYRTRQALMQPWNAKKFFEEFQYSIDDVNKKSDEIMAKWLGMGQKVPELGKNTGIRKIEEEITPTAAKGKAGGAGKTLAEALDTGVEKEAISLQQEYQKAIESTMSAEEKKLQQKEEFHNRAMAIFDAEYVAIMENAIAEAQAAEMKRKAHEDYLKAAEKVGSSLYSAFAQNFAQTKSVGDALVAASKKTMADVLNTIGQQEAVKAAVDTAEGFSLLFTPGMQGNAAGKFYSASLHAGAALLAGVAAGAVGGGGAGAGGGAGPGGGGGASPATTTQPEPVKTVIIEGLDRNKLFSGGMVIDLLNEAIGQGAVIKDRNGNIVAGMA